MANSSSTRNTYGDPDSSLFSQRTLANELSTYRRLLADAIPGYVLPGARKRILDAAEEYAWAKARERYAAIKELPDWRIEDFIPKALKP